MERKIQEVDLGMPVYGFTLPHPDPDDPHTVLCGLLKRVAVETPVPDEDLLKDINDRFMPRLLEALFPDPLSLWTDFSHLEWLKKTTYELWRRNHLLDIADKMNYDMIYDYFTKNGYSQKEVEKLFKVDGFIKDECYPEPKNSRGINARKDEGKVFFGPIFKAIEEIVFKLSFFIKKIPKTQRAQHIMDAIFAPGGLYASTDFTSFESCFRKKIMETFERPLYFHLIKDTPIANLFMMVYDRFILGLNRIIFRYFRVDIEATRMTGEMNTSLGNGWTNLCLILYVLEQSGYDIWADLLNVPLRVEGDDGVTRVDPVLKMKDDLFKKLGFVVKIDYFERLNLASFCGNVFDVEDLVIIPDIRKVIVSFGWTRAIYRNSKSSKRKQLLRAKAFSLLYEYAGCPILQNLALKVLDLTKGFKCLFNLSDSYKRDMHRLMMDDVKKNKLPTRDIPNNTRLLVEELYKIPVTMQLELESYIESLTEIQPLKHPYFDSILPNVWRQVDDMYVKPYDRTLEKYFWMAEEEPIPWTENFVDDVYKRYNVQHAEK